MSRPIEFKWMTLVGREMLTLEDDVVFVVQKSFPRDFCRVDKSTSSAASFIGAIKTNIILERARLKGNSLSGGC